MQLQKSHRLKLIWEYLITVTTGRFLMKKVLPEHGYGAVIQYDEIAQTPYFNYTDEQQTEHEVWFEDVRSMQAKFRLISEYNLRGAGYWQIMRLFRANWLLLSDTYRIIKQ